MRPTKHLIVLCISISISIFLNSFSFFLDARTAIHFFIHI